ncbi:MAG: hypothetical protein KZY61_05180 [Clostridiaceae bacterium]|nr:hypothetical protein [Clostridiaceae bacterium]MBW4858507.1 hypothetical protein [Clostridiaceae bacterium]MBW4867755.1 hypothetical protein [Clostridiaceae bacterium]MBW4868055.1 hypothetical protein [Clostridiaceae bacterium]
MNKRICIISNICLLLWFFLDMIGMNINGNILVTRSYKDDGIFFIIFLALFILFIVKERIGKYFLTAWLFMWFLAQFLSHWYFTIFGPSEGKVSYFADTIKLIPSFNIYIPDLYHMILHILILISLANMIVFCIGIRRKQNS